MSDQMSLFASDAPPPAMRPPASAKKDAEPPQRKKAFKVFYCLYPPADVAQAIAARRELLNQTTGLGGRPVQEHRLHVTLVHIGDWDEVPPSLLVAAQRAGDAVRAQPFDVAFDHALHFGRTGPCVLGSYQELAALKAFRLQLGMAMADQGLPVDPRFTPHVTLAYNGLAIASQAVEPVGWTVREFFLIKSHVGKSLHERVASWPLRG